MGQFNKEVKSTACDNNSYVSSPEVHREFILKGIGLNLNQVRSLRKFLNCILDITTLHIEFH